LGKLDIYICWRKRQWSLPCKCHSNDAKVLWFLSGCGYVVAKVSWVSSHFYSTNRFTRQSFVQIPYPNLDH